MFEEGGYSAGRSQYAALMVLGEESRRAVLNESFATGSSDAGYLALNFYSGVASSDYGTEALSRHRCRYRVF